MRKIVGILILCTISVLFCFNASAYAVIPQLLGPLTALLSIIPQILAFVGVAILTALVFARDTTKMWLYKIKELLTFRRITVSLISIVVLIGLAVLTFQLIEKGTKNTTSTITADNDRTGVEKLDTNISWNTFRYNADRTAHLDDLPGPTTGKPEWVFKAKTSKDVFFSSSPTIIGNRLYIGAQHGSFFSISGATYCIDLNTREEIWRRDTDIPIFSSPAVVAGRVYIGEGYHEHSGCRLRCLDANTGEPIWNFKTASHVESTPFISKGRLYFTAGADGIYCLDALAGEEIWHFPNVHADMAPLLVQDKLFFGTGYGDYRIYALNAHTGKEIWSKQMPYPVWSSPSAYQNLVFFGSGEGNFYESSPIPKGKVVALDQDNGDIIWEYQVGDAILSTIAYRNGYITFGARNGFVYSIEAETGDLHWKTDLYSPVVSSPAVTHDAVYAASDTGIIYCLDANDGNIRWEFDTQSVKGVYKFYSSPTIANGKLYIGSAGRYVFCLGSDNPIETVENR